MSDTMTKMDVLELKTRVRTGNDKLYAAWRKIIDYEWDAETHDQLMAQWDEGVKKLKELAAKLGFYFHDCLYIDENGKKLKRCMSLPTDPDPQAWCIVCLSERKYWEEELLAAMMGVKCYSCGGTEFYTTEGGRKLCARCHPPVKECP